MTTDVQQTISERLPLAVRSYERRPVNLRSVFLGLLGVIYLCALAPYNDYVLANTLLIGNFLPIGVLLFLLMLIMLVNAPLTRWAPRWALSSGEMSVILGMMLVACGVATSGVMRYLPAGLAGMWVHAGQNGDFMRILQDAKDSGMPDWLFPTFRSDSLIDHSFDPVVRDYWTRANVPEPTFWNYVKATPWGAWATPALMWGIFLAAFWGAILCMSVIVRRQWVENERLAFPLASIYLSVIETPRPGRALNTLFGSRLFWIAFGAVFAIHAIKAMAVYDPKHFPDIPLLFDFNNTFTERPWSFTEYYFRRSQLYFSIAGLTFFVQTKIAFSLWFFFVLSQIVRVLYGSYGGEWTGGMQTDAHIGSFMVFAFMIIWIGRRHWAIILRHMVGLNRPTDAQGRYMPYFLAGWGFAACMVGMVIWLCAAGMNVPGAIVITLLLLLIALVMARVLAEAGLMYITASFPLQRIWVYLANDMPAALTYRIPLINYLFGSWFNHNFGDVRESLAPFSTHALRVADDTAYAQERSWTRGIQFIAVLVLALGVAYIVSGASTLYVEYAHAATLDARQISPINGWPMDGSIKWQLLGGAVDYLPPRTGPADPHSRLAHLTAGAGITGLLGFLRLRFAAWPLHPMGFLLVFAWPMKRIWFSIFVGWLCKVMIVRFGGINMFRAARIFFIGIVLGEAGAAAFWLVVSVVLSSMGMDYHAITLLPE